MPKTLARWIAVAALALAAPLAAAQSLLPVRVQVHGDTARIDVGAPGMELADVTLEFDNPRGLTPQALGVSAQVLSLADPALLSRLPGSLTQLQGALPLLLTIEPLPGTLAFDGVVQVEVHTHALPYTYGSSFRLFKAPLGGAFRDITTQVSQGSVRARGTTGGFSQFLVLADLRRTGDVVAGKLDHLQARIALLPAAEAAPLEARRAAAEAAVAQERYDDALAELDALAARVQARTGTAIPQVWTAGGGAQNHAGELLAGVATAKFSIAYLRNFGH